LTAIRRAEIGQGLNHHLLQVHTSQVEVFATPGLNACQVKQLIDHRGHQLRLAVHRGEKFAPFLGFEFLHQQQFGVPQNDGHGRAQFVRGSG